MGPVKALAWRAAADARTRTLSVALFFVLYAVVQPIGYRRAFPTLADRQSFARSFGGNPSLELLYGTAHNLETVGGYASWRVAGVLAVCAAIFGLWTTTRAYRGEEEAGRHELVAAGALSRPAMFAARAAAVGLSLSALWLAICGGLVAGGLALGGSAYLALSVVSAALVYAGVGALASQLAPTGRGALGLGGGVLALDFVLRVVADTTDHPRLHWALPLGWAEELRPFVGARPAALLLPAAASLTLVALAFALEQRRDLGLGLLTPRDTRRPRRWLLGSPLQFAARTQASGLAVWTLGVGGFAAVLGTVAKSVADALSADLRERLGQFGADLVTVSGVLGLYFLFFVLAIALFCCSQLGAARAEEAEGRLETLCALPVSRASWLAGRLALAVAGATLLGVVAGLCAATAASATGASVSYLRLLGAGLNCLPASLLFLGLGTLLVAYVPRQGVGLSHALVSLAFFWELVGTLLDAPGWLLGLSPFNQIGLVPATPFRALPAAVMLAIGVAGMAGALLRFRSRDLVGA